MFFEVKYRRIIMKYINILIAIISGGLIITYIFTGFDFMSKERLIGTTQSLAFILFVYSLYLAYLSFKK